MNPKIDGIAVVALGMLFFLGVILLTDVTTTSGAAPATPLEQAPAASPGAPDPAAFAAPYETYVITQGPHGAILGHMAIDLAAGQGSPILSPIYGAVTEKYVDAYGNPTLVIENEVYRVTLLHGEYTVEVGQTVAQGDVVGAESNHGYTTDMAGNPCWERAGCGYHTHLNVFDKRLGANVNPLDLIDGG